MEKIIEIRDDVIEFGVACMPNMFSIKSAKFHYELADTYHSRVKLVNRQAPRGSAKSSIVGGVFPLHHIMFDEGAKFVVLISKTQWHAKKLLMTIKDTLDYSEGFRELFGYWGSHTFRKNTDEEIILKDGTMIMALGMGMQIRGLKHIHQRPTFVVLDDPEDENNTRTQDAMEKNLNILLGGMVPALDSERGRIWVIGTPQNASCMVMKLQEMSNWDSKVYSTIDFNKKTTLWPEKKNYEEALVELEAHKEIHRESFWYREYQCQIIGDESQLFREDDIRYWDGYLETNQMGECFLHITHLGQTRLENKEVLPVNTFMGIDPASSTSSRADYSTIFTVAYTKDGRIFCLPYYRGRVTPTDHANKIIEYWKLNRPRYTICEANGYQEMLRQYLRLKMLEEGFIIYGLEQKYTRKQKKVGEGSALESLQTFFANHLVYLQPNMQEFKDELLLYPRAKHDDLMDGFYYATRKIYKPDHNKQVESDDVRYYLRKQDFDLETAWLRA